MKLDFDITTAEYTVIRDILGRLLPPDATVWVFGSRAKGTARFNSDLDLAIDGKAAFSRSQIYALKEAFDDAPLSFRVDIVDLADVDAGFRKIIEAHRVSFPIFKARLKQLRFPEFSDLWKEKRIQDFLDEGILIGHLDGNHGELYPSSDEFSDEGVPYVSANDLVGGRVDFSRAKRLPLDRARKFKKGIAKSGDVLFAHNATVGPTAILITDLDYIILSTTVTYYRFKNEEYDSQFAYFALTSDKFVRQYSRVMSQSTRDQVPITTQRKFFLPLPTLPEQKKIAAFLGVVDAKIAALRAQVSGLETYKRGLMQALFSQTVRFTKPNGTAFPDWEEKEFDEIVFSVPTKNYQILSSEIMEIGLFPVIDQGKSEIAGFSNSHRKLLKNTGAIVFGDHTTEIKFIAVDFIIGADGTKVLRSKIANLKYLYYFLKMHNVSQEGYKRHFSILRQLVIHFPHPDEQQKIADALSAMDAKIQAVSAQVSHMETFKKGLLQQMFV